MQAGVSVAPPRFILDYTAHLNEARPLQTQSNLGT